MEEKDYYVYAYIRLDTNTYFYIGKGKRGRWKDLRNRNPHFKSIVELVPVVVEFLYENLTQEEALNLERDSIEQLVFNEGYSIEIKGYCERNKGLHLTNQSFGGDGSLGYKLSEEVKSKLSNGRKGKNNSFYGKKHTNETKEKISTIRKQKGLSKGENNPMYGKRGEKSPIKGRKHSGEELEKMSKSNPLRKEVFCIELNKSFNSLSRAENYIKETYNISFSRKKLGKLLNNKLSQDYYGEINIDGQLIKLHWKLLNTLND